MKKKPNFHVSDLRALPEDQQEELLRKLGPEDWEELLHTWEFWARPEQLEPEGKKWQVWMPLAGRGWGKDSKKSEDILTFNRGWIKLKDIKIGDYVYSWDGKPTKVIDFYDPEPRQLVEFTFSDKTTLTTSVEHDWVTWEHRDRKSLGRNSDTPLPENWPNWERSYRGNSFGPKKRTTQDIIDTFTTGKRGDTNHSIPVAEPLEGTYNPDIVDPYYLGYWLGDGFSASLHSLAVGDQDREYVKSVWPDLDYKGNCVVRGPVGSRDFLKTFKLKKNKHFPEILLRSSIEQRLEILQGLMDSDGYAESSKVEFCNTNKSIAYGTLELVRSLGQKPRIYTERATLNGKDCGEKYRVVWKPIRGINPFQLPRKRDKVTFGGKQESRNYHRMITSYRYVKYEPTRCISVDHPDHLFLLGKALIPTHNTRCGAEWVRHRVKSGDRRIACVAPTKGDVRRVMVEGESGLLGVCHKSDKTYKGVEIGMPTWTPTNNTMTWKNGAKAEFFSAEDPERLRGPNFQSAWTDELAAWNNMQDVWDMLQFTLRLAKPYRILVTTTPKPRKLIRQLIALSEESPEKYIVTYGSSYDNQDNINLEAFQAYEGTRLGRQELYAEILDEAAGSLWTRDILEEQTLKASEIPSKEDLNRIVISIDPAITENEESDLTGIIVAGVDVNGNTYILEDHTDQYTPQGWASKAISLYHEWEADRIVAEKNQGGSMVRHTLKTEDETVPVRLVHASKGKMARAEPVSALYEQKKVFHAEGLDKLEDQMVSWEPLGSIGSPDRLDAMVWAVTDLVLKGVAQPTLKLIYQPSLGLNDD